MITEVEVVVENGATAMTVREWSENAVQTLWSASFPIMTPTDAVLVLEHAGWLIDGEIAGADWGWWAVVTPVSNT